MGTRDDLKSGTEGGLIATDVPVAPVISALTQTPEQAETRGLRKSNKTLITTAIVLIIALIGVGAWKLFNIVMSGYRARVSNIQ